MGNAQTVTFFKNGQRLATPQALPESLHGKLLYPAITYRNVCLHYNFGPEPIAPLPFKCRMWQDAAVKDVSVTPACPAPKDGKYDVLFPVFLPDEGPYDWLDMYLKKNPQYVELSDRSLLKWAELSGISRQRGYGKDSYQSNDKPGMGFGLQVMEKFKIKDAFQNIIALQPRHFIVMEVRDNLMEDLRKQLSGEFPSQIFKKIAVVAMGEPPKTFRDNGKQLWLKDKQAALDAEWRTKVAEHGRKKLMKQKAKELERKKKEDEKKRKKMVEEGKKRAEEAKKKAAAAKAAAEKKKAAEEAAAKGETVEDAEEENKEGEMEVDEEAKKEDEKEEEKEEEPAPEKETAKLTAEEEKALFRPMKLPDLTP